MRKLLVFCSLCIFLVLSFGCVPRPSNPATAPSLTPVVLTEFPVPSVEPTQEASGLTDELLKNSTYLSPQAQAGIQLTDGQFTGEVEGIQLNSVMVPGIAYGDINDDGINDAAFILSENTGGSGLFASLIVVYSQEGEFTQTPGYFIDDRPLINNLTFDDGEFVLDVKVHGPNDPMVDPTLPAVFNFDVFDQSIVMTRLTTGAGDGSIRSIDISSPMNGELITDSATLVGAMPIGPFESNLSFRILDLNGQQLFQSGFMVTAEDMGAPATFNNSISLADLPTGQWVLLELSELSMADGSPLAVDTVLINVGGTPK